MMFSSKHKIIFTIIFSLILIAGVVVLLTNRGEERIACTLEAKLCPDGSTVGRMGPRCEFAPCPSITGTEGWKLFAGSVQGISFKYPDTISTTYIHTTDWPPVVNAIDDSFACTEAGAPTERAGETYEKIVNGRLYCITVVNNGAAGSIYSQYAYATEIENKSVVLTFGLRSVQCANYDEVERSACEAERVSFNIDELIDRIVGTLEINPTP